MDVIAVKDLWFNYGDLVVLKGINFSVKRGEVFSLLGTNGAGKTTLIRLLCGKMKASRGDIKVLNLVPYFEREELLKRIGLVEENSGHYKRLSVWDNLIFFAEIFGVELPANRVRELLELVELQDKAEEPVSSLSKGMRQRLALARALLHKPELLFLDEPSSGLDSYAAERLHKFILDYCSQGGTVFLTTHYLEEAEKLSSRVAILNEGEIVCCGNPLELCAEHLPEKVEIVRAGKKIFVAPGLEELFFKFTQKSWKRIES
ncbi:ABC transporter ATP-binding protein [bacterium]|nr:ABC transporter ATP-binding protein [bacterium]